MTTRKLRTIYSALVLASGAIAMGSIYAYNVEQDKRKATQDAVVLAWYKDAVESGCKPTGFLPNNAREPRAIWTCHDGRSIMQPERL